VPKVGGLAYDRFGATQLAQELNVSIGEDFAVPLGQDFATQGPLITEWERLIRLGLYVQGGNPVMRWMFGNIAIETDSQNRRRFSKKKARDNIDGASAALMGLDGIVRARGDDDAGDGPNILTA
jgi:phage terminase large subunit-like protein